MYFDSFKLLSSPGVYENLNIEYNKIIKNNPKTIKKGWYKESKIIPNRICNNAAEKSINNFDVPFCIEIVSKKRLANSGGYIL